MKVISRMISTKKIDLDKELIDDEELDERAIEKRNDVATYYSEFIEESYSE
jgi:hypothetical protein